MGSGGHHIVPFKTYLNILLILLALTALTVIAAPSVSGLHLGHLSTVLAIGIASTKAALVAAYFMHLKYDDKLYAVIIVSAVFFLLLLWAISSMDVFTRILQVSPL